MANTITGNMKVLKQNFLVAESVTLTASSGSASISNIKDFSRDTKWVSSGSDDTVIETIDATFDNSVTIDRLILLNMNFASFSAYYWDGSKWTNFTNVYSDEDSLAVFGGYYGSAIYGTSLYGLVNPSPKNGIEEQGNTSNSKYYEFDSVSTTKVRIEMFTTITADAEKFLFELYIGEEIGTFIDDPFGSPNSYRAVISNTRSNYITKSNGGTIKYERGDKYNADVNIRELLNEDDQDIINTMYDNGQFAIYPCGGVGYNQRGMRLQDLYNVIIRGNNQGEFAIGRTAAIGNNYRFQLLEQ